MIVKFSNLVYYIIKMFLKGIFKYDMVMLDVWLSLYIVYIDFMFIELDVLLFFYLLISFFGSKVVFWLNIEFFFILDFNLLLI